MSHAAEPDHFLALAESMSGVGRWRIALPSGEVSWSDQVYRIHGVDRSTFDPTVESGIHFYHPEDQVPVSQFVEKAIHDGDPFAFQLRIIRPDGELRHVICRAECILDDKGQASALLGVFQDITDAVKSTQELSERERQLRLLADNSSDLISQCDLSGRFVYVSPAVKPMTGYLSEEVLGRSASEFVHPDDRTRVVAEIQASLRNPDGRRIEHRHIRKDGREIWVQSRPRLVRDTKTGKPLAVIDAMRDITDQKRTQQELEHTQRDYRLLADNTADMISRFDLKGKMSYVSPSSLEMLGYLPEELVGHRTWEFVHDEDKSVLARRYEELLKSLEGDPPVHTQFRAQKKTGEWVWIEGSPKLIRRETGEPIEVIDVARDITARKEMEAELHAARSAAEAGAQAKSDFLANMSHELRTPLNSVIGFSRLIAEAPELEPETKRRAVLARDASQTLLTIVNDILDYSRFETDGISFSPESVELNDLVESVADLFRDEAVAKDIFLKIEVPVGSTRVEVDPLRLRQVLMNLVGNALKFTARGGIAISLSRDAVGRWKFAVRDTGVGIAANRQASIFERFAQADASIVRQYGGSGLGLTISKSIVEAMGGEIGVFSVEGAGSTFWFAVDLPASRWEFEAPRSAPAVGALRASILFVDDVPANCQLFQALIEQPDLEVTCVASGAEAIDLIQRWPYDVVFMDIQMPEMDGLEATRRIRKLGYDALPIVALTANVTKAAIEACIDAGMNGHLGKPFVAEEIVASISRWASSSCEAGKIGDLVSVESLTKTLGPAKMARFLDALSTQLSDLLRVINAPKAGATDIARVAHSVRGYAGSLGFASLASELALLEAACDEGEPSAEVVAFARSAVEEAMVSIPKIQTAA